MKIRLGTDIVEVKRIKELDEDSLNKIFHKSEQTDKPESMAGIFAVKEACKKVFNNLDWLNIEIKKQESGKPELILNKKEEKIESYDLSISHDGGFATATVVFLLKE